MVSKTPIAYRLYRLLWAGLDVLFPPTCGGCGKFGDRWCVECQCGITPLPEPICEICGHPQNKAGLCPDCQRSRPPYDQMRSWAVFKPPIQPALHRIKYKRDISLGDPLADSMLANLHTLGWTPHFLTVIPLSEQRQAERGYNQVNYLAHPIALGLGIPYRPQALRRTRHTNSQVGLTVHERKENVRDAFEATPQAVQGKTILLMDDVITTGATVSEAARALKMAGADAVYVFSAARAVRLADLKHA